MKHIKLTEDKTNSIVSQLQDVGYTATTKDKYVRYSKEYGNSVFIHHNLSIVRCRINTEASKIIERNSTILIYTPEALQKRVDYLKSLGKANGKAPESQDNGKSLSWFLNGYDGKSTTKIL